MTGHESGGLLDWGRVLVGDKLGPDAVPVVGAQIAAGDGAVRVALDVNAALDRHGPLASCPLAHSWLPDAELFSQKRLAPDVLDGALGRVHVPQYRHYR